MSKGVEILIVEDSLTQAEQLKYILEQYGYHVAVAHNGKRALAAMLDRKPQLVISDIVMPEMDGYQLCRQIKADDALRDVPVILLTSLADPQDVIRGLESGADNFLTKPYEEENLLSRLRQTLTNREPRQKSPAAETQNGVEIFFGGQKYFIRARRRQILDLLLSTYETAVQKNRELIETRDELQMLNEHLEERVEERTAALTAEIAERKRVEEALRESQHFIERVADATPSILYIYDSVEQRNVYTNLQVAAILGYTPEEVKRMRTVLTQTLLHPDDMERVYENNIRLLAAARDHDIIETEYRMRHANGEWRWLYGRETVFTRNSDGTPRQILGTAQDITDRKQAEDKINYLAYHDALTDLPNRTLFEDRLRHALTLAQNSEQMLAVLSIDIDRFKAINDTLGHTVGDQLLCGVAGRLSSCVRESDTVARVGGNEFAILLTQIKRANDSVKIAQNIHEALKPPFNFEGQELYATTSIGISLFPLDGEEIQTIVKNAGAALYRAKEQGGSNYQFYKADMNAEALKRLEMENDLRRMLERGECVVHYQPQVNVNSGQIVGMEALVRWQHSELGLISPAEFIPLAEETGLIVPIGEWVMRTACEQVKRWQELGLTPLRVSVNLSARQFQQPGLVEVVARALAETGLGPSYLELELTESSVMKNPEQAIVVLKALKAMEVRISIDDFGTGYSSLSYLKRFPLDVLKIDRTFVCDTTSDQNDAAIVRAIITLAHSLSRKVIAEGVETEEQLSFLRSLRCDEMQGYLFSKPLPAESFEQLLMKEIYQAES